MSRNEQRAFILFYGRKDLVQVRFTLRCIQWIATSVLRSQQYKFGVKSARLAEICIRYQGRLSVALTAAGIVLCIGHSENI